MKNVTKTLSGPGQKLYNAEYHQAESIDEVPAVVSAMGLTLEDVSEGLRRAKRDVYLAALDTTVDSKIQAAIAALVAIGFTPEDATAQAESQRSKIDNGLPQGLSVKLDEKTGQQAVGSRGRKASTESAAA